jgi:hypothetical protein
LLVTGATDGLQGLEVSADYILGVEECALARGEYEGDSSMPGQWLNLDSAELRHA